MNCYADTSFLLSLYREQTASAVANEIMRGVTGPLPLTPLVFLEIRNGLNLALFRGEMDATTRNAAWAHVQQDIRDGILGAGGRGNREWGVVSSKWWDGPSPLNYSTTRPLPTPY